MNFYLRFILDDYRIADLGQEITAQSEELRAEQRPLVKPGQGDWAGHQLPPRVVPGLRPGGGQWEVGEKELRRLRQEVVVSQGRGVATLVTELALIHNNK